jgi:cytochrome c
MQHTLNQTMYNLDQDMKKFSQRRKCVKEIQQYNEELHSTGLEGLNPNFSGEVCVTCGEPMYNGFCEICHGDLNWMVS